MKAGRIAFRVVLIVIISLTIGLTVYTWNSRKLLHDELPMPFGIGVSVVLTGSMEPTLEPNDLVVIKRAGSYSVGDIVVFQDGSSLVIHRIIEADEAEGTVVTKGDANSADDGNIPLENIKGKLSFSVPGVGKVIKALKSVPGIIITLTVAALLMFTSWNGEKKKSNSELDKLKEEIRKLKEENGPGADGGSDDKNV